MNATLRRLLAGFTALTLATAPTASFPGNLNAEMQAMFDDLGSLGNVTSPGAFRGQAMNLYTGGSLMMRAPGRNYPLVNAQLPRLKSVCGGSDLFGLAHSSHGFLRNDARSALGSAPADAIYHGGVDHPGAHSIDAQVLRGVVESGRLAEAADSVFRRDIARSPC